MKRHETYQICDICGRGEAETWTIGTPEAERARVDLCPRCDDPVRKAFIAGRKSGPSGPQGADTIEVSNNYEPSQQVRNQAGPILQAEPHWSAAQEKKRRDGNG